MEIISIEQVADYIISLYEKYGDEDYIGEPVSQVEHMYQAALLAEAEGYSNEVVLAAFFHDIGHLCEHIMEVEQMDGYGVVDHEKLGADFLLKFGFSGTIASLVKNHVEAKRYLTRRYPEYYERLSEASKHTLAFQGGRMSEEEAELFESDPLFDLHLKLRRWDEQAKLENIPMSGLQRFRTLIIQHLSQQQYEN